MKLIYRITLRLALIMLPILLLWAGIFYYAMVEEINDETDDSLEDYAELIIRRTLTGQELPSSGDGTNNTYTIELLSGTAQHCTSIEYEDRDVLIPEKGETEPARTLNMVFHDAEGRAYRLSVSTPTFERNDLLKAILLHLGLLYIILILTILLATALIVHYSLRPLYTLLRWLDNYKPGKGVKDLPKENSSIEFQKLTQAAHDTIERAEIQIDIEKQFIGNASHELQTPLAVLSTRIEWLMDKTSLTEEQFAELTKMRQSLHRLIRLNRTLLLLSKIDNGQFPDKSDIDIVGLVKSEIETYNEIFADKELTVHMELPSKSSISMNESLAATLVTNLIKNAFLHTSAGGDITIKYYSRQLTVSNSGDTAIDGQKIFNRFYTSGKTGSTGLGLALVKSIAGYYDFGLDYSFSNGRHCFTVKF